MAIPAWHWSLQPNAEEIRARISQNRRHPPGCTCGSKIHAGNASGRRWTVENRRSPKCPLGCTCARHSTRNSGQFQLGHSQTNPNSLAALRRGAEVLAERKRGIGDYEGKFTYTLKSLVWERDGGACRECGRGQEKGRGRALVVHHLDYDKANNDLDNLILLCRRCHLGGHARGAWPIELNRRALQ